MTTLIASALKTANTWCRVQSLLVITITAFTAAAIYMSLVIIERQDSLGKVSRYNVAYSASQGINEYLRLRNRIAEYGDPSGGVTRDEIQLRFDILIGRMRLFQGGEFQQFVRQSDRVADVVGRMTLVLNDIGSHLNQLDDPRMRRYVLERMTPLESDLVGLSSRSNRYGAELVAADQSELIRLHYIFSLLALCLVVCGLVLIALLFRHNGLLRRAHDRLHTLNESLCATTDELGKANGAVQLANDELREQNALFDAALSNMSQGLCMFDGDQHLIVSNRRFAVLYGLGDEPLECGWTLSSIVDQTVKAGTFSRDNAKQYLAEQRAHILRKEPALMHQELADGRIIAMSFHPLADDGWIATYEDITERHHAHQQIAHMARHDPLTDLPNRMHLRERLDDALDRARRNGDSLAVFLMDLDNFKSLNDTLGQQIGDELLRQVAQRAVSLVRHDDTVSRTDADEFVLVWSDVESREQANRLSERMIKLVSEPYWLNGHQVMIGASVGGALAFEHGDTAEDLLKNADMALSRAKAEGRGAHHCFEPEMDTRLRWHRRIETDLHAADLHNQLEMAYQPIIRLSDSKIVAVEALLRWNHPDHGYISPADFIPVAEHSGAIVALGAWALRTACEESTRFPKDVSVAVNLSAIQFRRDNIVETVAHTLEDVGLDPKRLEIEVTESLFLEDSREVLKTLDKFRAQGIKLSLDDFGTGYSSLNYLHKFKVDKLKIDRAFVQKITEGADGLAIVRAIVGLASTLDIETTAEGIETAQQLDIIRRTGCDQAQGFLISKPKSAVEIQTLLSRQVHGVAAA